jgi:hypothetical protein
MTDYLYYAGSAFVLISTMGAAIAKDHETKMQILMWCQIFVLAFIADTLRGLLP